ncbi:hypothetical protein SK128_006541 [Halocaridina rubra]|uniref:Uncharacterized protein n=1 Tax=Halocaridina rubra TaxID=373956 RepID=A0AAN9A7K1_HALRR
MRRHTWTFDRRSMEAEMRAVEDSLSYQRTPGTSSPVASIIKRTWHPLTSHQNSGEEEALKCLSSQPSSVCTRSLLTPGLISLVFLTLLHMYKRLSPLRKGIMLFTCLQPCWGRMRRTTYLLLNVNHLVLLLVVKQQPQVMTALHILSSSCLRKYLVTSFSSYKTSVSDTDTCHKPGRLALLYPFPSFHRQSQASFPHILLQLSDVVHSPQPTHVLAPGQPSTETMVFCHSTDASLPLRAVHLPLPYQCCGLS